jgi:co-chaperonin GroES (HSP10)
VVKGNTVFFLRGTGCEIEYMDEKLLVLDKDAVLAVAN